MEYTTRQKEKKRKGKNKKKRKIKEREDVREAKNAFDFSLDYLVGKFWNC